MNLPLPPFILHNFKKAGQHCLNSCKFHNTHFVSVICNDLTHRWYTHASLVTVCRFSSISNTTRSTEEKCKHGKNELYFLVLSMGITTGRKKWQNGPKTGKREAWKYSQKCKMFKCERKDGGEKRNPWRKMLKDCFPMINTTDKTKKGALSYHNASSGMTPLSVSCTCWKSE